MFIFLYCFGAVPRLLMQVGYFVFGFSSTILIISIKKDSTFDFFSKLTDEQANYAYAEGKWTIKEVVGHLTDAERTFAYRILAFSRGQEELPGFDENTYVEKSNFNSRTLQNLAAEFKTVREANLYMLRALTPEQLAATGIANGSTCWNTAC